MANLSIKQKIIGIVAIIGTILILIFQRGFSSDKSVTVLEKQSQQIIQTDTPEIVSTNPDPLNQATLWAMQPIEITFNMPLENIPELKYKIEPQTDMKVELTNGRKTVKFTPIKPLPLGVGFTLLIPGEAKFDGKKTLGKEYLFHFRTIEYRGV